MRIRKYIYYSLIVPLLVLSSCTTIYLEETAERQIVVFSSIGGAGDNGYNDLITKGITRVYMDLRGVTMNYLTPETMEQAESSIYEWIDNSSRKAAHTLLVLAASDYRDITEKILLDPDLNPMNEVEILVFEIPELPQSQNNIKAYSFMIPMDGASYQAGEYAAEIGCTNPLIWLAYAGIACFALCTVFQLVTLPTEFNASRRALESMQSCGVLYDSEVDSARKVLRAAAMTYVAALAVSFMQLLRFILIVRRRR